MNSCNHVGWFHLFGRDKCHIHYGNRVQRAIKEMTNAESQYPSTIFFVGAKTKDIALRELFPHNNLRRGCLDGTVNLRLDSSTISSKFPLLFADGNPQAQLPHRLGTMICHENTVAPLTSRPSAQYNNVLYSYARLVALFSDVVCLFAEDLGGLAGTAKFLVNWVRFGNPSSLPKCVRPRVVIVTREEEAPATYSILEIDDLRVMLDKEDRSLVFSSISLIHLPGDQISALARHRRLKEILFKEVDLSRIQRIEQRVLFSAIHLEAFSYQAFKHLIQSTNKQFDFIANSRIDNQLDESFDDHMALFASLCNESYIPSKEVASFVASSILVDAYPPRMHGFDPRTIFQQLYKKTCFSAFLGASNSVQFAESLCTCIEDCMDQLFPSIDGGFETSAQLHISNVRSHSLLWSQIKSHATCLFCLRRRPEHVLTCEHAICDVCIMIYGNAVIGKEAHFELSHCILCGNRGAVVARLKPVTAGVRILTIDGGGVRGVVPLEFLRLLQGLLGPGLSVQDLFDQAFGTSSGGLIVLGLFLRHWDVGYCTHIFDTLVRDFFGIHLTKGYGILTRFRDYFRTWLSDGCYDVSLLEKSLKDIFGVNRRMFDIDSTGVSGQKIAVTATTLSDASTYIFSNYNGYKTREKGCGYKHVRADKIEDEPFIWEAGRATSAAPGLFTPAHIASLGSFQDGGLRHNNPMDLALWECPKLWPSNAAPDVLLSLGTGTEMALKSPKAPHFRHILNDGFIPRLCRSFISSLDGERAWRDLTNRLNDDSRSDYFRLNVSFTGDEPRLDDIRQMDDLRKSVHLQPNGHRDRVKIAFALLVTSFFFELAERPLFEGGQYLCKGFIRCRNDSHAVLKALASIHSTELDFVMETGSLGILTSTDICSTCRTFCKKVWFPVRHLEDIVTIDLRVHELERRKISGFPHNLQWFVHQQRLQAKFGTVDHDSHLNARCRACRTSGPPSLRPEKKRKRDNSELRHLSDKRIKPWCGLSGKRTRLRRLQTDC